MIVQATLRNSIDFYWDDPEYLKHAILPIGCNAWGDPILIGLNSQKIYFTERSNFQSELIEIADSFTDLLANIIFEDKD